MNRAALVLSTLVSCALAGPAARANFVLTGASVFDATSTGAAGTTNIWDTTPGDSYYNIYFTSPNTGIGGSFINSGDGAALAPNFNMGVGSYQFYMFADPGAVLSYHGINLFLNGSTSPAISAFAATDISAPPGHPSFSADSSATRGLDGSYGTPGAGTLSVMSGGLTATLTDFFWASPSVFNLDRVGTSGVGGDGANDFVGSITINVTSAVPEPSSLMLCGLGVVATGWAARLRRKSPAPRV